jgi:hypothetical protein
MSATAAVSPWGDFVVEEGRTAHWRIGPLQLWVANLPLEWRVQSVQRDEPLSHDLAVENPSDAPPPEDAALLRFSFETPSARLTLTPALADRAMVVRPDAPLLVPSGETTTLFVSTPVWVKVELERAGRLLELPSHRPSDTWFGPSTISGEFCYASRTAARLSLDELPFRPHRAITPLRLSNKAHDPLAFEKVKLPVQYLSVYRAASGFLWTEAVTMRREEAGEMAALDIGHAPPAQAGPVVKLSGPRQSGGRNLVVRAFSRLFRHA